MAAESSRTAATPWYLHGKTVMLGAGALAAAGLAVIGLWDRVFPADEVDVASINSVDILRRSSLGDFTSVVIGKDFVLTPMSATARGDLPVAFAAYPDAAALPTPSFVNPTVAPPPTGGVIAPTAEPTTSASATAQPTVTTDSVSPQPSSAEPAPPPQGGTTAPTTGTAPSPLPSSGVSTPSPTTSPGSSPWDTLLGRALANPALDGYALTTQGASWVIPDPAFVTHATEGVDPNDPGSGPLSAEEVAERLAEALGHIETVHDGGLLDPLGWAVVVNVSLEGYDGVPLLLTWSLDGVDVPSTWAATNVAYRVIATTPRDSGSAEIWIPDLKEPDAYNLNVSLALESAPSFIVSRSEPLQLPLPQ